MDNRIFLLMGGGGGGTEPVLDTLEVSANGTYTPPAGTDGYDEVIVDVEPTLETKSITVNGTYTPAQGYDGFDEVTVSVTPALETKSITTNGTYTPSTGKDGFSQVTVNVPSSQVPFTYSHTYYLFAGQQSGSSDAAIYALNNLQNKTFTDTSNCRGMFYAFKGDLGDISFATTSSSNSIDGYEMFRYSNLTGIPNLSNALFCFCDGMFANSSGLVNLTIKVDNSYNNGVSFNSFVTNNTLIEVPPTIVLNNGNTLRISSVDNMFSGCKKITNFDNVFQNNISFDASGITYISLKSVFSNCSSMLEIPSWYYTLAHDLFDTAQSVVSYAPIYYGEFSCCCCCRNFENLPIPSINLNSNVFVSEAFNFLSSCEHLTFETNNGNPISANWKNQILDLTNTGYAYMSTYKPVNFVPNLFAQNKEITNTSTYEQLKNDPYRWTSNDDYGRYDHNSAVETINSLPDCSAYATGSNVNTIKFKGTSGRYTDGGAISNLTAEEIAVATAKGWTVSIV